MFRTLTDAARAVRAKEVSPVELVEEALERSSRWHPVINAFSQVHAEQALREAAAIADHVARDEETGPLAGVPVAAKDLFDVAGWETSGSSLAYRGSVARADAEVVARLRRAGAIVIGKTNQHELACGGTNSVSAHGPARNPWDPTRITGGSSGGSAAAVAARVVPLALGTDTGGSIRIPASFCGVAGLKPTFGLLPMDGVMPLAPSLDTAGAMAATVEDLALAHPVLAGLGAGWVEATGGALAGIRVAVLGGFFSTRVDGQVLEALERAVAVLGAAGLEIVPADVGAIEDAPEVWSILTMSEFASGHGRLLRRPETLYPMTRSSMEWGMQRTAVDYLHARERAAAIREDFLHALAEVDLLIAPATIFPAPPQGADEVEVAGDLVGVHRGGAGWLTRPVSLTGLPTLSIPIGRSREGLPLGAQLIGRDGDEALLLRVGMAYQRETDHHLEAPTPRTRAR